MYFLSSTFIIFECRTALHTALKKAKDGFGGSVTLRIISFSVKLMKIISLTTLIFMGSNKHLIIISKICKYL